MASLKVSSGCRIDAVSWKRSVPCQRWYVVFQSFTLLKRFHDFGQMRSQLRSYSYYQYYISDISLVEYDCQIFSLTACIRKTTMSFEGKTSSRSPETAEHQQLGLKKDAAAAINRRVNMERIPCFCWLKHRHISKFCLSKTAMLQELGKIMLILYFFIQRISKGTNKYFC